jgi:SPP1 gp7 family putative phage head morphogenesis protein
MKEVLDAVKELSQYYEFDIKELVKITGLPITKIKAAMGLPEPEPGSAQKKKNKPDGFSLTGPYVYTAPRIGGVGLIYAAIWDKAYDDLIKDIREGKIKAGDLNKDFIMKTYDRLNKSAELGYGKDYYNDETARKMRQNLLEFAAVKTHVQQKEVQSYSDSTEDKKLYESRAKKYLNLQNGAYLDVQASWSARSAQSARRWQEFQRDKDIYPNVKFRTMMDKDVRPAHAVLEGMIIAVDDPALDEYTPPLDPRCRCWLEQTREGVTSAEPDYHPDPQWSGNTGKTGIIFNDKNSYNKKVESKEDRANIRTQAELVKEFMPYNKVIKVGDNNVYVNDFADQSDLEQNIIAARKIARELEKDVYIRHHVDGGIVKDHKNPELAIGKRNYLGDLKSYDGEGNFTNFIKNAMKSVNKQGAEYAVFDISTHDDISDVGRFIKGSLLNQNKGIKRIVLIKGDNVAEITRRQAENLDFAALERLKEK